MKNFWNFGKIESAESSWVSLQAIPLKISILLLTRMYNTVWVQYLKADSQSQQVCLLHSTAKKDRLCIVHDHMFAQTRQAPWSAGYRTSMCSSRWIVSHDLHTLKKGKVDYLSLCCAELTCSMITSKIWIIWIAIVGIDC